MYGARVPNIHSSCSQSIQHGCLACPSTHLLAKSTKFKFIPENNSMPFTYRLLKDMNDVMRTYVLEAKAQMPRTPARKKVTFQTDSVEGVDSGVATGDSELVAWLEDIQLDHTSIQRFVAEQLTLSDVRDHMTREDIVDLKIKYVTSV